MRTVSGFGIHSRRQTVKSKLRHFTEKALKPVARGHARITVHQYVAHRPGHHRSEAVVDTDIPLNRL